MEMYQPKNDEKDNGGSNSKDDKNETEEKGSETLSGYQLLLNYCLGHRDSKLLL